jgi:hypothetical protein
MHGAPGRVSVGGRKKHVSLAKLVERRKRDDPEDWEFSVNLSKKTVYLGSCSTMRNQADIKEFRRLTGARMVCGYTKDVDWMESAAFELLLLNRLAANANPVEALRPLFRDHRGLIKRLGFSAIPKPRPK